MNRAEAYAFMSAQRYGVVSSVADDGTPQSALVGLAVTPELEIVFDTLQSTRKYRNLKARPSCSVVLGWAGEQTVQLEGQALEPTGPDLDRYRELYFLPWPDGRSRLDWPGLVHLVVRPHWIRYSDYDQSPPRIETVDLATIDAG